MSTGVPGSPGLLAINPSPEVDKSGLAGKLGNEAMGFESPSRSLAQSKHASTSAQLLALATHSGCSDTAGSS